MRKLYLSLVSVSSAAALIIGCSSARSQSDIQPIPKSSTTQPAPTKQAALQPVNPKLVAANNQFGFELFKKLRQQNDKANLLVSPMSIATALTMTYNGASGDTEHAMAQSLNLDGLSLPEVNQASAHLKHNLEQGDPQVQLSIANSLWGRQEYPLAPEFVNTGKRFFDAEITTLNFTDPAAVQTINAWVKQSTRGKIPSIIDSIPENAGLYLINAIYFKGTWQKKFDAKLTKDGEFVLAGGTKKTIPFMAQSGKYRYLKDNDFAALALPYGNGNTGLYLFLPQEGQSLDTLMQRLDNKNWDEWMSRFEQRQGNIKIPRFKIDYEQALSSVLKNMGMAVAFDINKANFSRMRVANDLYISEVKHKALMEVNEEGTEAAAATSVEMGVKSAMPPQERFSFVANRPFLAVLRDNRSGSILFMSAVREPK